MSNINVTPGSGKTVATETIAGIEYGQVKVVGGQTGSTSVWGINPDNSAQVSVIGTVKISGSVSGTIGASIIGVVPVSFAAQSNQSVSGTVGASIIGALNISSTIGAVQPYAQPNAFVQGSPSVITGTASVLVLSAPSGTNRNYIGTILVTNTAATATVVNIVDNGQVIYAGYAAAAGGGFSTSFPVPLRQPTSALGLYAQTPTQASVLVSANGYVAT